MTLPHVLEQRDLISGSRCKIDMAALTGENTPIPMPASDGVREAKAGTGTNDEACAAVRGCTWLQRQQLISREVVNGVGYGGKVIDQLNTRDGQGLRKLVTV